MARVGPGSLRPPMRPGRCVGSAGAVQLGPWPLSAAWLDSLPVARWYAARPPLPWRRAAHDRWFQGGGKPIVGACRYERPDGSRVPVAHARRVVANAASDEPGHDRTPRSGRPARMADEPSDQGRSLPAALVPPLDGDPSPAAELGWNGVGHARSSDVTSASTGTRHGAPQRRRTRGPLSSRWNGTDWHFAALPRPRSCSCRSRSSPEGVGLALFLVLSVAAAVAGVPDVSALPPGGCCFRRSLRASSPTNPQVLALRAAGRSAARSRGRSRTALKVYAVVPILARREWRAARRGGGCPRGLRRGKRRALVDLHLAVRRDLAAPGVTDRWAACRRRCCSIRTSSAPRCRRTASSATARAGPVRTRGPASCSSPRCATCALRAGSRCRSSGRPPNITLRQWPSRSRAGCRSGSSLIATLPTYLLGLILLAYEIVRRTPRRWSRNRSPSASSAGFGRLPPTSSQRAADARSRVPSAAASRYSPDDRVMRPRVHEVAPQRSHVRVDQRQAHVHLALLRMAGPPGNGREEPAQDHLALPVLRRDRGQPAVADERAQHLRLEARRSSGRADSSSAVRVAHAAIVRRTGPGQLALVRGRRGRSSA